jgi:hypothetical protein
MMNAIKSYNCNTIPTRSTYLFPTDMLPRFTDLFPTDILTRITHLFPTHMLTRFTDLFPTDMITSFPDLFPTDMLTRFTLSSTNKTDRHDITEILLKVALNTLNQANKNIINRNISLILWSKITVYLIQ